MGSGTIAVTCDSRAGRDLGSSLRVHKLWMDDFLLSLLWLRSTSVKGCQGDKSATRGSDVDLTDVDHED